jgi:hypothetical protein
MLLEPYRGTCAPQLDSSERTGLIGMASSSKTMEEFERDGCDFEGGAAQELVSGLRSNQSRYKSFRSPLCCMRGLSYSSHFSRKPPQGIQA